ncbi:MAG: hypothetical protein LBV71_09275 [Prevotella sp.]|jgi:hypothetical protein|nr:hypothetical protein [Prevotella sp.]
MEKNFTEQDSLRLINEMINQAKNNVQKGSANSMILWGYVTAIVAITNFILLHTLEIPYYSFHIWWIMILVGVISTVMTRRSDKEATVRTHIDKIVSSAWNGFSISVVIFLIIIFTTVYLTRSWALTWVITPVILTIMGLAQYVTATACRYKLFYYAAGIFWGGALVCLISFYIFPRADIQFILLAICMVLGLAIPGHMLNKKATQNV